MKTIALTVALVLAAGIAQAADVADADGNGTYSMDEMKVTYPDLTEAEFTLADVNGDGAIDADELMAAVESGTLPQ